MSTDWIKDREESAASRNRMMDARIAQLEAELAEARAALNVIRQAFGAWRPGQEMIQLLDCQAALAAAHEALAAAFWVLLRVDDPTNEILQEAARGARKLADTALSAPALADAAEELRLLRELEAITFAGFKASAEFDRTPSAATMATLDLVSRQQEAALAALRSFHERGRT